MKHTKIKLRASVTLFIATLFLAACGDKPQPETPAQPTKLFEQERDALEKAKQAEQAVAQGAEEQKREIEKQTQ